MKTMMHTLFNLRHLRAARLVHRRVMRALRHHAMRRRALDQAGGSHAASKPVDNLRAWFLSFFSMLRAGVGSVGRNVSRMVNRGAHAERVSHGGARHFSPRALPGQVAAAMSPRTPPLSATAGRYTANGPNGIIRRPRRMAAGSENWYAFAMR